MDDTLTISDVEPKTVGCQLSNDQTTMVLHDAIWLLSHSQLKRHTLSNRRHLQSTLVDFRRTDSDAECVDAVQEEADL